MTALVIIFIVVAVLAAGVTIFFGIKDLREERRLAKGERADTSSAEAKKAPEKKN